jgi:hypothetical protein
MPRWKPSAAITAAAFTLLACGSQSTSGTSTAMNSAISSTDSRAADLRTRLDHLLGEHEMLAAKATEAALGGRTDEFTAYGELLNKNGVELGQLTESALGTDAANRFGQVWSAHDGFLIDYATAIVKSDRAAQERAAAGLNGQFVPQFADFAGTAVGVSRDGAAEMARQHVARTRQLVDDQAKKDWTRVYTDLRAAYAYMRTIGDGLAPAIAKKQAAQFSGDPRTRAVDLRVSLNQLLQEHAYLSTLATDAALAGRTDEFQAAGQALNDNGGDLGRAIGGVYGSAAQTRFNQIWASQNGLVVDYTTGLARKDRASEDRASGLLDTSYVSQFAEFLSGTTGLPKDSLANLLRTHVQAIRDVVDAQGAKDIRTAAQKDRIAAQHMEMFGDSLASAIVKKVPQKFA